MPSPRPNRCPIGLIRSLSPRPCRQPTTPHSPLTQPRTTDPRTTQRHPYPPRTHPRTAHRKPTTRRRQRKHRNSPLGPKQTRLTIPHRLQRPQTRRPCRRRHLDHTIPSTIVIPPRLDHVIVVPARVDLAGASHVIAILPRVILRRARGPGSEEGPAGRVDGSGTGREDGPGLVVA